MSRSDIHRLQHVLMVADEVAAVVARRRDAFDDDATSRRALERCLEIFGEAAKAVSTETRAATPEVPTRAITPT